jgi:two-component system, sensor histidine kinase and response regulator
MINLKQLPIETTLNSPSLSGMSVLIVDEDQSNRILLLQQVSAWDMIGAQTGSGEQALDMLKAAARKVPFDLVVVDLIEGFGLARRIKSDPNISSVKIVLLPSLGQHMHAEFAREVGIAAYMQKPVRPSELYNCLLEVVVEAAANGELSEAVEPTSSQSVSFDGRGKAVASNTRILVVEDNALNMEIVLDQLVSLGYTADSASNGIEAVEAIKVQKYDIVLMDRDMPEMDGVEATAEIRALDGDSSHTVIIALTANAIKGEREKCLAAGMDDYLSKPLKIEALSRMLEKWIDPESEIQTQITS